MIQQLRCSFVCADGAHLATEHRQAKDEAHQRYQEEEEDRASWGHGAARIPLSPGIAAQDRDAQQEQNVGRGKSKVHCEKQEVLLVVLTYAVVDPGTVVVVLADAALAHCTVVSSLRYGRVAVGTVGHCVRPRRVTQGHRAWVGQHSP